MKAVNCYFFDDIFTSVQPLLCPEYNWFQCQSHLLDASFDGLKDLCMAYLWAELSQRSRLNLLLSSALLCPKYTSFLCQRHPLNASSDEPQLSRYRCVWPMCGLNSYRHQGWICSYKSEAKESEDAGSKGLESNAMLGGSDMGLNWLSMEGSFWLKTDPMTTAFAML